MPTSAEESQPSSEAPAEVEDTAVDQTPAEESQSELANDSQSGDQVPDNSQLTEEPDDSWRQPFEELGFKDIETQEEANQRLLEAHRRQNEEFRRLQDELAYQRGVVSQLGQTGQPQPVAPQQPEADGDERKSPLQKLADSWVDLDPQVSQYVETDENGNVSWRSGTPDTVRRQAAARQELDMNWRSMLSDPRQFISAINAHVESMLDGRVEGELSQWQTRTQEEQAEQKFLQENAWLYAVDPITKTTQSDPITGRPVLSKEGQQFATILNRVRESGVQNKRDQIELAMQIMEGHRAKAAAGPFEQRQASNDQAAQARQNMLGRTNGNPTQPTTAAGISDQPGSEPTGKTRMTLGQAVAAELFADS